ncbi:MAG: hypothetical protein N3E50_04295 [Candidatus Goldbacteria bacterium]|nr:hypothetical protein [Candidatus Goldiibacteriota bacterium]
MQKIVFIFSLLWLSVFFLPEKKYKFIFLTFVDVVIFIFLLVMKIKSAFIFMLLMLITNFFILFMEEEDINFNKKDFIFFIGLIPILFFTIAGIKYKSVLPVEITIIEQIHIIFLFFLTTITCFFILKKILSRQDIDR